MNVGQKRDGSTVYARLKESAKEHRTARHQEFMDRKLGHTPQDQVSTSNSSSGSSKLWSDVARSLENFDAALESTPPPAPSASQQLWADVAQRLEEPAASEAQGAAPPAPAGPAPQICTETQLVRGEDGLLHWVFPGEPLPAQASSQAPLATDLWKQVGESLGMSVESNPQGALVFSDK